MQGRMRPTTWIAFGAATAVTLGSLWLTLGMQLKACPLCFYQRTFVMSIVGVMGVGALARFAPSSMLSLLALPLAAGGLGVSLVHVSLEASGQLECPLGVGGVGTAPQQALAGLAIVTMLLLTDCLLARSRGEERLIHVLAGLAIGGVLTAAAVQTSPPLPPAPSQPYTQPPDMCRPPYRDAAA